MDAFNVMKENLIIEDEFRNETFAQMAKIFFEYKIGKFNKTKTLKKKEKGCTEPLYGKKSKCVINIVPQEDRVATFKMDKKCIKTRE